MFWFIVGNCFFYYCFDFVMLGEIGWGLSRMGWFFKGLVLCVVLVGCGLGDESDSVVEFVVCVYKVLLEWCDKFVKYFFGSEFVGLV